MEKTREQGCFGHQSAGQSWQSSHQALSGAKYFPQSFLEDLLLVENDEEEGPRGLKLQDCLRERCFPIRPSNKVGGAHHREKPVRVRRAKKAELRRQSVGPWQALRTILEAPPKDDFAAKEEQIVEFVEKH